MVRLRGSGTLEGSRGRGGVHPGGTSTLLLWPLVRRGRFGEGDTSGDSPSTSLLEARVMVLVGSKGCRSTMAYSPSSWGRRHSTCSLGPVVTLRVTTARFPSPRRLATVAVRVPPAGKERRTLAPSRRSWVQIRAPTSVGERAAKGATTSVVVETAMGVGAASSELAVVVVMLFVVASWVVEVVVVGASSVFAVVVVVVVVVMLFVVVPWVVEVVVVGVGSLESMSERGGKKGGCF